MPHTLDSLAHDLRRLGVEPGDTLFVHSSFKSLGPVEGGAETVVRAMEAALGPEGLLLMPSFNLVENDKRAATWNIETSPSTVGWLTEFFRRMPGTHRSDHYSHSVAARGRGAARFVSGHLRNEGMKSPWEKLRWGKTYGVHSPMMRAYRADGKVLMLGVTYKSSTYMHVVEVTSWNRRLAADPKAEYYWVNREVLGEYWDATGAQNRGRLGDADCRLFRIRAFVDALVEAVEREPQRFFKYYPG